MSCNWHIWCKQCDSTHEFDNADHNLDDVQSLIEHKIGLLELRLALDECGPSVCVIARVGHGEHLVDLDWFAEHSGHELVPRNEYER